MSRLLFLAIQKFSDQNYLRNFRGRNIGSTCTGVNTIIRRVGPGVFFGRREKLEIYRFDEKRY